MATRSQMSDFKIMGKLGAGSFGVVSKVKRLADNQIYVLKQIQLADMTRKEKAESINEVKILASMDSPYVVKYYDSFMEASHPARPALRRAPAAAAARGLLPPAETTRRRRHRRCRRRPCSWTR